MRFRLPSLADFGDDFPVRDVAVEQVSNRGCGPKATRYSPSC